MGHGKQLEMPSKSTLPTTSTSPPSSWHNQMTKRQTSSHLDLPLKNPTRLTSPTISKESNTWNGHKETNSYNLLLTIQMFFSDTPGVAALPAYDLDTGQATPICRKPYRPALQWKPKIEQELQNLLDAAPPPLPGPVPLYLYPIKQET